MELAQLSHLSGRLVRGYGHLQSQKGGIGLRGPGETVLETDRRLLRIRIAPKAPHKRGRHQPLQRRMALLPRRHVHCVDHRRGPRRQGFGCPHRQRCTDESTNDHHGDSNEKDTHEQRFQ